MMASLIFLRGVYRFRPRFSHFLSAREKPFV